MHVLDRVPRMVGLSVAAAIAAIAFAAPQAQAGLLVSPATDCEEQELSQPFLPWLDSAQYTPLGDGGFEAGGEGWTLTGGAKVVNGNNSHQVGGEDDSKSLRLPAGASATSPAICVGLEHLTIRAFARNQGSLLSSVRVDVLFEDAAGNVLSLPIGLHLGGSSWQPTVPFLVIANLLPLLPGEHTAVAFRFTAQGLGANWRIDDVYVDPFRRS